MVGSASPTARSILQDREYLTHGTHLTHSGKHLTHLREHLTHDSACLPLAEVAQ